jgi:hypothetical protein
LREVEAPTFSDVRLIDGDKVVSSTQDRFLSPGRFLVLISVSDVVDHRTIVRLEGLDLPHPGLEPATFQLVV